MLICLCAPAFPSAARPRIFFFISRGESPVAWPTAKPRKRDALTEDTPTTTILDTAVLKYGPESISVRVKTHTLYARASRPGTTRLRSLLLTRDSKLPS